MAESMIYDYYYGDESSQFSFYRIPRQLVTGPQFKKISTDAKLLYGLLLDRMGLSARNGWYDTEGKVYIFYTLDEIEEDLGCGHEKAVKLLSELDTVKGCGLIERVWRPHSIISKAGLTYIVTCSEKSPRQSPMSADGCSASTAIWRPGTRWLHRTRKNPTRRPLMTCWPVWTMRMPQYPQRRSRKHIFLKRKLNAKSPFQ